MAKSNPKNAGRKTDLTENLFRQIKESILNGNDLRQTAKVCEIPESTLYTWHSDNYLNIRDKVEGWKRDRKLMLAENVLEEMLEMPINVLKTKDDSVPYITTEPSLVRIKQDTAKFIAETLGKDKYSKRSELTGKDGERLIPKPLLGGQSNGISNNDGNTETISP